MTTPDKTTPPAVTPAAHHDTSYPTTSPDALRTIDRPPTPTREATPAAQRVLRELVNETAEDGSVLDTLMPAPHLGPRFSQRQLARLVLAGRSYQSVQAWLKGEPVPATTVEYLERDLQRVDARQEERTVRLQDDEIAIIVRR